MTRFGYEHAASDQATREWWRRRQRATAAAAAVVIAVVASACGPSTQPVSSTATDLSELLGRTLPDVRVAGPTGTDALLRSEVSSGPTLLFVLRPSDCLSCADFATDIKVLRNSFPQLHTRIIATGDDLALTREYLALHRLGDMLLDGSQSGLLDSLQIRQSAPIAILVDTAARILSIEMRQPVSFRMFPASRRLSLVAAAVGNGTPLEPQRSAGLVAMPQ